MHLAYNFEQTPYFGPGYVLSMAKPVVLTAAEFAALGALIDGDRRQRSMPPEIREHLSELRLIERREWPDGPAWRTARGNRLVREGK